MLKISSSSELDLTMLQLGRGGTRTPDTVRTMRKLALGTCTESGTPAPGCLEKWVHGTGVSHLSSHVPNPACSFHTHRLLGDLDRSRLWRRGDRERDRRS